MAEEQKTYGTIVTDMGVQLITDATMEGKKINITHLAVGDGNGEYYKPESIMTSLKNEKWRGAINSVSINEQSPNMINVIAVVPASVGGFTIREMAIFNESGTMIAICNTPDTEKVIITTGAAGEIELTMHIEISNTGDISFIIDPSVITATKKDIGDHNASSSAHAELFHQQAQEMNTALGALKDNVEQQIGENATSIDQLNDEVNTSITDIAYKQAGGTANAITVTKQGFSLVDGQYVEFKATANNTGSMTIQVNAEDAKALKDEDGENLDSGDIEANKRYRAIYDETNDFFLLATKGGIKINGTEQGTFQIATGQTITKGDLIAFFNDRILKCKRDGTNIGAKYVFNNDGTHFIYVNMITSTKAFACYVDGVTARSDYGTACVLDINGTTVTAGAETVFNSSGGAHYMRTTMITPTKALVCYRARRAHTFGAACVLDINGTTVTAGAETAFSNDRVQQIVVTMLTSTKALVCYVNISSNSFYGTACVLDINGTTVTAGAETVFNRGGTHFIYVNMLTPTKALVCYKANSTSNYGTARVLDINGTTVTAGAETAFSNDRVQSIYVTMLTSTKALVCYRYDSNSNYGAARVLDINGTTVTAGAETVFNSSGGAHYMRTTMITPTKALVCYRDSSNSNYGTACVLDINGTTVTAGAITVFNSGIYAGYGILITMITPTKALACYRDSSNYDYGTACVLDINGTTVTAGAEIVFNSSLVHHMAVTMLTPTKALVCYTDDSNSYYGAACILDLNAIHKGPHGVALKSGTENQSIDVLHWKEPTE